MKITVGIFDAKTRLSELCDKVAETGIEYVITRRGRPLARIVGVNPEPTGNTGILARMRHTERDYGPITPDGEDFPDVWDVRQGSQPSPLDGVHESEEHQNP